MYEVLLINEITTQNEIFFLCQAIGKRHVDKTSQVNLRVKGIVIFLGHSAISLGTSTLPKKIDSIR